MGNTCVGAGAGQGDESNVVVDVEVDAIGDMDNHDSQMITQDISDVEEEEEEEEERQHGTGVTRSRHHNNSKWLQELYCWCASRVFRSVTCAITVNSWICIQRKICCCLIGL